MTDHSRGELKRLILKYEELDSDERRRADELLARYDDLRLEFVRLQEIEAAAVESIPVVDDSFWEESRLDPATDKAERQSYTEIRDSLNLDGIEPKTGRRGRILSWIRPRVLLSLAAVMTGLLLIPLWPTQPMLLHDLVIETVTPGPDARRDGLVRESVPGNLRSGQAFALSFALEKDSHVLVVYVDPDGSGQLVHPAGPQASSTKLPGGATYSIPDAAGGESWVLSGRTGTESFIVGASEDQLDLAGLRREIGSLTERQTEREVFVAGLLALLERKCDSAERIEFTHVD